MIYILNAQAGIVLVTLKRDRIRKLETFCVNKYLDNVSLIINIAQETIVAMDLLFPPDKAAMIPVITDVEFILDDSLVPSIEGLSASPWHLRDGRDRYSIVADGDTFNELEDVAFAIGPLTFSVTEGLLTGITVEKECLKCE